MKAIKRNVIALAVSAGLAQMAMADTVSDQSEAKGFVEGSSLTGLLRNYYFNRDNKNTKADQKDWTQGVSGVFSSGFTQGTVGVGVDAWGQWGIKLDGGDGYTGSGNLALDTRADGTQHDKDQYSSAGGDIKVRISKTELKYGNLQPTAPVFAVGGSRLFSQYATGFDLNSSEIKGLDLEAGHFTSTDGPTTSDHEHEIYATYANVTANSASFGGAKYQINPNWTATFYGAHLEDVWNQYYFNTNFTLPITDTQSVNFDANLYRTLDTGAAKAGDISNTTWSLAAAYSFLTAHTITLSYQKVDSDQPFDYIGVGNNGGGEGGDSILLANSIQYSDFNGPHEQSVGVRYDLNMASYGVPGLSFMARHMEGFDIDGSHENAIYANSFGEGSNAKHRETNLEAKYVIQEGPAKDLSFRVREAFHRGTDDQADGDHNETRLIVDYPFTLL